MIRPPPKHCAAVAVSCCLIAPATAAPAQPMVIAPHISGGAFCDSAAADLGIITEDDAQADCARKGENSADRITALLDRIGPALSPSGHFALGYTLDLPLMRFYATTPTGWVLDTRSIDLAVRTIHDVKRKVVVYLSANHFTDGGLALSDSLAGDPANLMWTKSGPLKPERYFSVAMHAWTLSNPDAPITKMRKAAFSAMLGAICRLDSESRARVAGLSVLGEVHQLYGNFTAGQGYSAGFDITDYSPPAVAGFRKFLANKFGTVAALNTMAGSAFASFDAVSPPSKDIRHDVLHSFFEHIDATAAGVVPVQGWAFDPSGTPVPLAIFLDGKERARIVANLNRADVPEAVPAVTTPNVGWRYDLDYRHEATGVHTLEVFLAQPGKRLVRIVRQGLTVVARDQSPSQALPALSVDADAQAPNPAVLVDVDGPAPLAALFYNPLAELWLAYRNQMVADYIKSFAEIADASCLPHEVIFSHQLLPELNSSWDADLEAVNASQVPNQAYGQGATLYGGAVWGQAFFDWKDRHGWDTYAVSEMHPRFALPVPALDAMLEAHRLHGARYVAPYFVSITPKRLTLPLTAGLNSFLISPENHQVGSDAFYSAIVDTMHNH